MPTQLAAWLRRSAKPLAASAVLAVSLAACARPSASRVARVSREPDIRVALAVGAREVRIAGQGGVTVAAAGRPAFRLGSRDEIRIVRDGRAVRVSGGAGAGRYESLSFVTLDRSRFVIVNGKPYRGVVEVRAGSGGVTAVNRLPLEAYLAGVVTAEMGRREPNERAALEAQAIVSRTYALFSRGKYDTDGYDLRSSTADQIYGGADAESEQGRGAVRATRGQVVTYRGDLIEAFFFSTCGYATASPEEVFRFGRERPYLRSVSDRRSGGHYCDISPHYRWTVEWDGDDLRNILRRTIPRTLGIDAASVDVIKQVRVHRTGPSGRVTELRIQVGGGEIPVFGPDVRGVLQRPGGRSIGSTALQLRTDRAGGRVTRLVAQAAGLGHGVGLCQWGAIGRARAGQDAHTIVTTYFPGTRVERWY